MIVVKSKEEIEKMRKAGRIVAEALDAVTKEAKVKVTTKELDRIAESVITDAGAKPAFRGYKPDFVHCEPFPATICASVNAEVVHGIPNNRQLEEGDLLSIDIGAEIDGYYGDATVSVVIGNGSPLASKLVDVTRQALYSAIRVCRAGRRLSDVSHAIQVVAESQGFSVVKRFVGHGIGTSMHEDPPVPNYGEPGNGPVLKPGMVLALEPMLNEGTSDVIASPERWIVVTKDGKLSAHFEHTVAITEGEPDVLTVL
ncbi:MAG: type I methionyl aminopeptidase [Actinomycetota bacterium]|nr:type I methionyl aminopeptidase [Actinomycetota bacterium]